MNVQLPYDLQVRFIIDRYQAEAAHAVPLRLAQRPTPRRVTGAQGLHPRWWKTWSHVHFHLPLRPLYPLAP
jgi:hypothetical protein